MILDPLNALANFFLGLIKQGKIQAWVKLLMSIFGTSFVSFFGTFGMVVPALYYKLGAEGAFILGLAAGCLAMATSVLFLWRRSGLTKGLPIVVPGKIEGALQQTLQDESMVMDERK